MFEGEYREALQILIDNGTIIKENKKTPCDTLDAISMTIKAEEHFWAHRDGLLFDSKQQPNEGIHALSQCICNLIISASSPMSKPWRCWRSCSYSMQCASMRPETGIHLQDQSKLTYQSLLSHCKLLESRCKQYQKARERGWDDLMSISAATASASSIHTDTFNIQACCNEYGYMHPPIKCPMYGQQCYTCGGLNHYTAFCRQKNRRPKQNHKIPWWGQNNPWSNASRHRSWCSSRPPGRQSCHCHNQSCSTSCNPFHSLSHSPSCSTSPLVSLTPSWAYTS